MLVSIADAAYRIDVDCDVGIDEVIKQVGNDK